MEIKLNGRGYPLLLLDALTWKEWREAKRMSGVNPANFFTALKELDPDAWTAYVLISVRRENPAILDDALDDENFMEAITAWLATVTDEEIVGADAGPPVPTPTAPALAGTPNGDAQSSDDSGSSPSSETTPGVAGHSTT